MDKPEAPFQLMYRRPGREDYEKLTDVIDDLCLRIEALEEENRKLREQD